MKNVIYVAGMGKAQLSVMKHRLLRQPLLVGSCITKLIDNLTSVITECTIAVGVKVSRRDTGKLSQETKDLVKKRQSMKVSHSTDRIELAELPKLIKRRKVADITKSNMERIELALQNGRSLKAVKRKLGIGKDQMYALRDKNGNVITNMDTIVKVANEFYRDLYSSRDNQDDNGRRICLEELDIPPVTPEEVNKALGAMQRGKAAGQDQITADLLEDAGRIVLEKHQQGHLRLLPCMNGKALA